MTGRPYAGRPMENNGPGMTHANEFTPRPLVQICRCAAGQHTLQKPPLKDWENIFIARRRRAEIATNLVRIFIH
jgi:hypothetical protein